MSNVQITLTPVGDPDLFEALVDAQLVSNRTLTPCSYRHTNGRVYLLRPKEPGESLATFVGETQDVGGPE